MHTRLNFKIRSDCGMFAEASARATPGDEGLDILIRASRDEPDVSDDERRAVCSVEILVTVWDKQRQGSRSYQESRETQFYGDLFADLRLFALENFATTQEIEEWLTLPTVVELLPSSPDDQTAAPPTNL